MDENIKLSPFEKGGDTEGVQETLRTIALWEAAAGLRNARVLPGNFIAENRTDFFTPDQNELIDCYVSYKTQAVATVIKTFNKNITKVPS